MQNKITDIKQQQKNTARFSIYVDNKYMFSLDDVDLLKEKLSVGQVLTESDVERVKIRSEEGKCMHYALSLVQSRMYTEREIRRKLCLKKYSDDSIEITLSELKRYNYIDDYSYAEMYAKEVEAKFGKLKIKQKLYEKGISSEIIQSILETVDNGNAAVEILKRKWRNLPIDGDDKQKAFRFLAQRGFDFEHAKKAIDTYMEAFYE